METLSYKKEFKAVKPHICNFCGERISAGEKYNKSTHKQDGEIYDWKTHLHCDYLADKLKMYDDEDTDGLTGDAFQEYIYGEYLDLIFACFSEEDLKKYSDVIQQLRHVRFMEKLVFVLRHHKKNDQLSPTK